MNKEIKIKWLELLRSGKISQGKNALKDRDGNFCCLGALCLIHQEVTGQSKDTWKLNINGSYSYIEENNYILPSIVKEWAELDFANPITSIDDPEDQKYHHSLGHLNDNGWTFNQIADQIEKDF